MRFVRRNTVIQNVIHLFGIQFFHPFRHHHRGNAVTHQVLWSSFFGHADQMVGLCTGGQLGGRAGQRFVLCG